MSGDQMQLESSWRKALAGLGVDALLAEFDALISAEEAIGVQVAPDRADVLAAFACTPFDRVRVVVLGQDPYHGPGQATGLAFSVPRGVAVPPSLRNIQRELRDDIGGAEPGHGDLRSWADQGVLLLNTSLTVRLGEPGSHGRWGWERLTSAAVRAVAQEHNGVVFLLWGRHARSFGADIDRSRHLVLEAAHPSPLSARRGFFGCRHFSQTNAWLRARGQSPIQWQLPAAMR